MKTTTKDITREIAFLKEIVQQLETMDEVAIERMKRLQFYMDISTAQQKLTNYTIRLSVRKNEPTYGEIAFYHDNLKKYETLRRFAWAYGFVVSVQGSKNKKVLRGEKRLKYTA